MANPPPAKPHQPPAPAESADRAEGGAGGGGPSILIVDDNEQNLELLQAYVEDLEADVRVARDGVEALRLVDERQPDVVLLDVMMPRMSGFQACMKLKSNAVTRDIPVIMITALNEISDVEKAVESGADDFLTKPVNRLELTTRVRSLLRVRLLKRQLDRTLEQVRRLQGRGP